MKIEDVIEKVFTSKNPETGGEPPENLAWVIFENGTVFLAAPSEQTPLEIDFEPGDIYYVYNHVILHARSAYEDWPEPERKRHLFRLWLHTDGARPLDEEVAASLQGIVVEGTVPETPLEAA